jgi:hypothetical protein
LILETIGHFQSGKKLQSVSQTLINHTLIIPGIQAGDNQPAGGWTEFQTQPGIGIKGRLGGYNQTDVGCQKPPAVRGSILQVEKAQLKGIFDSRRPGAEAD